MTKTSPSFNATLSRGLAALRRGSMVGLVALAPATLPACSTSRADADPSATHAATPAKATRAERPAVPVTVLAVTEAPSDLPLVTTGRVAHARDVKPAFKTGGVLRELLVDEGDRVVPGQLLARLDPRELDAGIAQARAALGKAQRDLALAEKLTADAVLPGTTRDDAKTAATVARAQLAGLAFNKETMTLTATTSGVVIKRLAEPGEIVGPGMPVLVIGEVGDETRVEVGVPARLFSRIAPGAEASVRLDGDTREHAASIVEVAPTLTPGTDRVLVTLALRPDPTSAPLPRGLSVTATFPPRAGKTLPALPIRALVEGEGREASVWMQDPQAANRVVRHLVTVAAIRPDGLALIASGLSVGDEVIDAGTGWLDADATITRATPPAPRATEAKP
ncbi:MAG: efflux RND transporter periplasmic adaptor subunit [Deltaproteobacteria bacterium]|nr:efflux RND transporter periplasmic adaptor subunit [Deltaproteobacteria bacterium]